MANKVKKEETVHTAIRLPVSLLKKARVVAEKQKRTVSFIIVEALAKSINKKAA